MYIEVKGAKMNSYRYELNSNKQQKKDLLLKFNVCSAYRRILISKLDLFEEEYNKNSSDFIDDIRKEHPHLYKIHLNTLHTILLNLYIDYRNTDFNKTKLENNPNYVFLKFPDVQMFKDGKLKIKDVSKLKVKDFKYGGWEWTYDTKLIKENGKWFVEWFEFGS